MRKRILIVAGTRPECIKLAPLCKELKHQDFADVVLLGTGQHLQMSNQALHAFGLKFDEELPLEASNRSLGRVAGELFSHLDQAVERIGPDLMLVQGDTLSAMVASLIAFYRKIAVGHVEAGLRTYDLDHPFPEELHRRVTAIAAALHFAPTEGARDHLLSEGIAPDRIVVTGNTGIDALLSLSSSTPPCEYPATPANRLVLVTIHRRENQGAVQRELCCAIRTLHDRFPDVEFVVPVHPNPNVAPVLQKELSDLERVHLVPPADYPSIIALLKASHLVLTDSGGLQEEAPVFGKPVLVLRKKTERPEALQAGAARVAGISKDEVVAQASLLLSSSNALSEMSKQCSPFGDGLASERIADRCRRWLYPES
jgi:UDP-N-acetylglucosamine 2-epimerase (non-hydrolysing)